MKTKESGVMDIQEARAELEKLTEIKEALQFIDGFDGYKYHSINNHRSADWLNGALYAFQEQQKKIDREWTDIKDKLPPFDNDGARPCYRLLVSLTHGTVTEVSYWGKGEFYLNGSLVEGVKYWMLLPNSPI